MTAIQPSDSTLRDQIDSDSYNNTLNVISNKLKKYSRMFEAELTIKTGITSPELCQDFCQFNMTKMPFSIHNILETLFTRSFSLGIEQF